MLLLNLIKKECHPYSYQLVYNSEQVNVLHVRAKNAVICQLNADINFALFKGALLEMGDFIEKHQIKHVVIDKRNMVTLHLPSMQWFYLDWMQQMYATGLRTLYKLLPNNTLFKFSLQMGKDKILAAHPHLANTQLQIHYYNDLAEVLGAI